MILLEDVEYVGQFVNFQSVFGAFGGGQHDGTPQEIHGAERLGIVPSLHCGRDGGSARVLRHG